MDEETALDRGQFGPHLTDQAGPLVDVQPLAQQRLYELRPEPWRALHEWLEGYRRVWDARFDELDALIGDLTRQTAQAKESRHGRKRRR